MEERPKHTRPTEEQAEAAASIDKTGPEYGPKPAAKGEVEVDKGTYVTHAELDAAIKPLHDCYTMLSADFMRLVQAVQHMNHYQQRIPEVTATCEAILQPDPELTKANEALAEARACKLKIGRLQSVIADWDSNWQYLFTWRGEHGYSTMPGFDLRHDKPGFAALKEALVVHNVPLENCRLIEPVQEKGSGIARRIIWQAAAKK